MDHIDDSIGRFLLVLQPPVPITFRLNLRNQCCCQTWTSEQAKGYRHNILLH